MSMRFAFAFAALLASITAAQAQHSNAVIGHTPAPTPSVASQFTGRAATDAQQAMDINQGTANLYTSPDGRAPADPNIPATPGAQRLIGGTLSTSDPVIHYPYGRYDSTLGTVNPNSAANPYLAPTLAPPLTPAGSPPARAFGDVNRPAFAPHR
jgi:hypothetical protein